MKIDTDFLVNSLAGVTGAVTFNSIGNGDWYQLIGSLLSAVGAFIAFQQLSNAVHERQERNCQVQEQEVRDYIDKISEVNQDVIALIQQDLGKIALKVAEIREETIKLKVQIEIIRLLVPRLILPEKE